MDTINSITGTSDLQSIFKNVNQSTTNIIKLKDKNGDNELTDEEFGSCQGVVFSDFDKNGDNKIDGRELNAALFTHQLNQISIDLTRAKDTNGDMLLSADELGLTQDAFNMIDTNNDGTADTGELNTAYVNSLAFQMSDNISTNLINTKDTNGDMLLSADELGLTQDAFSKIDTNNDGTADISELNIAYMSDNISTDLISTKDTNSDKLLNVDELGLTQDAFSKIDTNNDGTAGELNAAYLLKTQIKEYLKTINTSTSGNTTSIVA